MGLKNVVQRVADKAANRVAKLSALSSEQVQAVQLLREDYLLEMPDPTGATITERMMAASSIEIFNAYLSQIKELYLPIEKEAE
ncbi:MAG: hypothetical protein IK093_13615, partial [Ruminiclostridium sp.]|nr:hypothetical protein [Ruminiclostridium sp.]